MTYPYESATPEQRAIGSLWWCVHHAIKLEPLTEPIENRVRYIMTEKPEHERETRLKALRPVVGKLPEKLQRVYDEYQRAKAEWKRAYDEYQRAKAEWWRVYAEHAAEIDALWAVECADVPWGPDGLIFPEVKP